MTRRKKPTAVPKPAESSAPVETTEEPQPIGGQEAADRAQATFDAVQAALAAGHCRIVPQVNVKNVGHYGNEFIVDATNWAVIPEPLPE